MTEEKYKEDTNEVSMKLSTMLSLETYTDLTEYAKVVAKTGFGKWDYGVAIKRLLDNRDTLAMFTSIYSELAEIRESIKLLEAKKEPEEEEEPAGFGKSEESEEKEQ